MIRLSVMFRHMLKRQNPSIEIEVGVQAAFAILRDEDPPTAANVSPDRPLRYTSHEVPSRENVHRSFSHKG